MIHPDTCIRKINDLIGYGVFATEFIPMGTITYVKDSLEIEVDPDRYRALDRHARAVVEKYSYIDPAGMRIVSWDLAKYVNHHCEFNSLSTGYGFEIAVRDIEAGEELTDEYGLFNLLESFPCGCGARSCRGTIHTDDLLRHGAHWDALARAALNRLRGVEQPLWSLIDPATRRAVGHFVQTGNRYRSVHRLQYFQPAVTLEAS